MKRIVIHQATETKNQSNPETRRIFYENLSRDTLITKKDANVLGRLETFGKLRNPPDSNIESILSIYLMNFMIPIVETVEYRKYTKQTKSQFAVKDTNQVAVQLDRVIIAISNEKYIFIPKNTLFVVYGFRAIDAYALHRFSEMSYVNNSNICDIVHSGGYSHYNHNYPKSDSSSYDAFYSMFEKMLGIKLLDKKVMLPKNNPVHVLKKLIGVVNDKVLWETSSATSLFFYTQRYLETFDFSQRSAIPEKPTVGKSINRGIMKTLSDILPFSIDGLGMENQVQYMEMKGYLTLYNRLLYNPADPVTISLVKASKESLSNKKQTHLREAALAKLKRTDMLKSMISLRMFGNPTVVKTTPAQQLIINNALGVLLGKIKSEDPLQVTVRELSDAISEGDINTIKKLYKIIKNNTSFKNSDKTYIQHNGFNIICPHVLLRARMIIESKSNNVSSSPYILNSVITEFSAPMTDMGYSCKVCGEHLSDNDTNIVDFDQSSQINDPENAIIWNQVAVIISSYVKFKDIIDIQKLISQITEIISPKVKEISLKFSKVKTKTEKSILEIREIYTAVYTIAFAINLIFTNYGKVTFSVRYLTKPSSRKQDSIVEDIPNTQKKVGGKGRGKVLDAKHDKSILKNIFDNALYIFTRAKGPLMRRVKINTGADKILAGAYKWIRSLGNFNAVASQTSVEIYDLLKADPIYTVIKDYTRLLSYTTKSPKSNQETFTKVLNLDEITKGIDIYKSFNLEKVSNIESLTDRELYYYKSIEHMLRYVSEGTYQEMANPVSPMITDLAKEYTFIGELEKKITSENKYAKLRMIINHSYLGIGAAKFSLSSDLDSLNLSSEYCNDGKLHKFNQNIFRQSKSSKSEVVSNSHIDKLLRSGKKKELKDLFKLTHITKKCLLCGSLKNATSKKDLRKIIDISQEITALYNYYETSCPKGNLHEFSGENCSKCGYSDKIANSQSKKYYEKYLSEYRANQAVVNVVYVAPKDPIIKQVKKYPAWDMSNVNINKFAKLYKTNLIELYNIGYNENKIYDSSVDSHTGSSDVDKVLSVQYLKSYIYFVVRSFNLIKNSSIGANLGNMKKIWDANKAAIKSGDMEIKIAQDFYEKTKFYETTLKLDSLHNFISEYLFGMLISLESASSSKKYKEFTKSFVHFCIKHILTSEMEVSKVHDSKIVVKRYVEVAEPDQGVTDDEGGFDDSSEEEVEDEDPIDIPDVMDALDVETIEEYEENMGTVN
jgi:hypothetical protein